MRFRIIPSTITVATLLLCVKLMDITHNTDALAQAAAAKPADAATKPADAAAKPADAGAKPADASKPADKAAGAFKPADPTPAAPAVPPPADPAKGAPAAAIPAPPPDTVSAKATPPNMPSATPAKPAEGGKEGKDKPEDNPAVTAGPGTTVDRRYTPVEVELLQNLAQRRDELDRWERNVMIKESTLSATEKRIDEKIMQVEAMKKEVASLLSQYNEKEDAKIRSLVKIYENMKPKDAARIFDEVEMPILLLVIDKMSEKKVAPILAYMDSRKAKAITVQLAEQRRINNKLVTPGLPAP